jgi:hypothetical protein
VGEVFHAAPPRPTQPSAQVPEISRPNEILNALLPADFERPRGTRF